MNNLKMFCLTLEPKHINFIKSLDYIPVGLGDKNFSNDCFGDKEGENISIKNKFYGEYTFHYWLWKNYFSKNNESKWIGFCQYRKFWVEKMIQTPIDIHNLNRHILKNVPSDLENYDVILGTPFFINQRRTMKFLKKGLSLIVANPKLLFDEKLRNIKFHFDLMHGKNNLNKAIELLDTKNKIEFKNFVTNEVSFNPHNMLICKSQDILIDYYKTIFPWLKACEKVFGFNNLKGYGLTRIYGFLAERFMSYWFKKNTKYKELPILFFDINNHLK